MNKKELVFSPVLDWFFSVRVRVIRYQYPTILLCCLFAGDLCLFLWNLLIGPPSPAIVVVYQSKAIFCNVNKVLLRCHIAQKNSTNCYTNQLAVLFSLYKDYRWNLTLYRTFCCYLCSTGAFRDSGAGAGLGNFWKRWVRVRRDSAIKKIKKYFYLYF